MYRLRDNTERTVDVIPNILLTLEGHPTSNLPKKFLRSNTPASRRCDHKWPCLLTHNVQRRTAAPVKTGPPYAPRPPPTGHPSTLSSHLGQKLSRQSPTSRSTTFQPNLHDDHVHGFNRPSAKRPKAWKTPRDPGIMWCGGVWHAEKPVCCLKTLPCVPATRAHVFQHVRVVPVHTGTF